MEGPSLVILKEEVAPFKGKIIKEAKGYAKIDFSQLEHKKVIDFKTWGKHFLICFKDFTVRVHFGLFGNYRINDRKKGVNASVHLAFSNGELNCYVASAKIIKEDLDEVYDWRLDMLSAKWSAAYVKKMLLEQDKNKQIGDLLLNADIFSGVGNIIRNEVLYRVKVHPESKLGDIPPEKITALIKQTRTYSKDFLKWKKKDELKKHWEVYEQKECPLKHPIQKKYTGKTKRRSYICKTCMKKY
jgi:endonuclease VIII